jgi:hypothetical protein
MRIGKVKSSSEFVSEFVKEIDRIAGLNGLSYVDAVVHYCETNNIEVETAASIIKQSTVLKAKLQLEAENLNLVRKSGRLHI